MTPRDRARSTFPDVELRTARLRLRSFGREHVDGNSATCRDELSQRWLPLPNPYTEEESVTWCTQTAPAFRTSGDGIQWAIERDGRFAGSIGLHRTDWLNRESEVGYLVAPWTRGQGVAGEALIAVARWLLLDREFERLVLRHSPGNRASQRVAEKAGFVREGLLRSAAFTHAGRTDLVLWSLVRSDLR